MIWDLIVSHHGKAWGDDKNLSFQFLIIAYLFTSNDHVISSINRLLNKIRIFTIYSGIKRQCGDNS